MNLWLKSAIIGVIAATAMFLYQKKVRQNRQLPEYTVSYTIKTEPNPASSKPYSPASAMNIISKRLDAAQYQHDIRQEGKNSIITRLYHITDTAIPVSMLTADGRIQFTEVYNLSETSEMLQMALNIPKEETTAEKEKPEKKQEDSISVKEVMLADDLEPLPEVEPPPANKALEIITILPPYREEGNGRLIYPAEIGMVKLKDTAAAMALLTTENVRKLTPAGLRICFGQPEKITKNKKETEQQVRFYFIKTSADSQVITVLQNEDIEDARPDYDQYGKVQVNMEFKKRSVRKWTNMTRNNIGRPIAIVLDNTVLSAPNVISEIPDGVSTISGNFTVAECSMLAEALKNEILPAKAGIITVEVKEEPKRLQLSKILLFTLGAFVVVTGLAFFVFKTLKAS